MTELVPSDEAVRRRADAVEAALRRFVAVVGAVSSLCSVLPANLPEVGDIQALVGILAEGAPSTLADAEWLIHSFVQRSAQLDSILLSSVA